MAGKIIGAETTLTTPVSTDLIPIARPGDTTARHALASDFTSLVVTPLSISGTFTYPSTYPATIAGEGANETGPAVQLLVQNTADHAVVSQDYRNEVHLRLQAGTTTDHRRYINFADYNGTDKWVMGANASHVFVLYNSTTVHRLWFEEGGKNYIASGAGEPTYIGYHSSDTVGGGLVIYSGGAPASNTRLAQIYHTGDDTDTRFLLNGGRTTAVNAYLHFQDQATTKYYLGKASTNGFALYDLDNSMYALYWLPTNQRLAVGHSNPYATLHPKLISALTASPTGVLALSHSTSGTPATGFGGAIRFLLESTTTDDRDAAWVIGDWGVATDASREGRLRITAYYTTTAYEGFRVQGDSSGAAKIGFYGATAILKPNITGSRDGNAALADLLTKLASLGLITDGTTAS